MMMSSSNTRYQQHNHLHHPFTTSQWQELEHQALVFKYMISGMQIPPDLLFTIRRSLDSSLSSKLLLHQPQHHMIGSWNIGFQMGGYGRKIDPEPGRCRRTDGKKWRCSKEAFPDSKYCERHMHRGRNRSRKPVEILKPTSSPPSNINASITRNTHYTHSRPINALSSQEPNPYRNSYGNAMKGEAANEHPFSDWQLLSPDLTMGSSMKHTWEQQQNNHHYSCEMPNIGIRDDDHHQQQQPSKKVMHHFLDEWAPKHKEDTEDDFNTHLSISSMPNSLHDFFIKEK